VKECRTNSDKSFVASHSVRQ